VGIDVGIRAPEFSLPDENGRDVSVPLGGRTTVLVFYRGGW
jgi:peroxiredoxin